jgi:hypothetical protein
MRVISETHPEHEPSYASVPLEGCSVCFQAADLAIPISPSSLVGIAAADRHLCAFG